ncbi:MAG: protein phosphatase CheZ [bacterium]|nr:protein phosphatase CheZ [bacterium]
MKQNAAKLQEALDLLLVSLPQDKSAALMPGLLAQMGQVLAQASSMDPESLSELVGRWETTAEDPLFNELGQLLRRFHDNLTHLPDALPAGLGQVSADEVGSMSGKLRHVLELTEGAANRTLDLSEEALEALREEATELKQLKVGLNDLAQEKCLTQRAAGKIEAAMAQVEQALNNNQSHSERIGNILVTQDYQDLSGQLIQKMLDLMARLEADLGSLLGRYGQKLHPKAEGVPLEGPLKDDHQDRHDQTDVDALLDQFGF